MTEFDKCALKAIGTVDSEDFEQAITDYNEDYENDPMDRLERSVREFLATLEVVALGRAERGLWAPGEGIFNQVDAYRAGYVWAHMEKNSW